MKNIPLGILTFLHKDFFQREHTSIIQVQCVILQISLMVLSPNPAFWEKRNKLKDEDILYFHSVSQLCKSRTGASGAKRQLL